jgi:hypothetical protein
MVNPPLLNFHQIIKNNPQNTYSSVAVPGISEIIFPVGVITLICKPNTPWRKEAKQNDKILV